VLIRILRKDVKLNNITCILGIRLLHCMLTSILLRSWTIRDVSINELRLVEMSTRDDLDAI
jgi:hypothetical protein